MPFAALLPARRLAARTLALALLAATAAACGGDDGPSAPPPNGAACDVATPTGNIAIGQTNNGTLSQADCKAPDGSYADLYRLVLNSERDVEILLSSTAFDAYLLILDADGEVIEEDDDSAGGTNAGLAGTLPAGTYFIAANSASANETGAYQLRIE